MTLLHSDLLSSVYHGSSLDPDFVAEAMAGQRADALIFDAPFSAKTHAGHAAAAASDTARFGRAFAAGVGKKSALTRYAKRAAASLTGGRRDLAYPSFDAHQIAAFCDLWLPLTDGWIVSITDDVLAPLWTAAFTRAGRYVFAPLPLIEIGGRVRLSGDGPSSWACWIVVARPRGLPYSRWGTLPGAYVQPAEKKRVVGGKPFQSMCGIIRDYSRRGDLVVDPFSGGGTTLAAAKQQGRRSIGIDASLLHAKQSAQRVARMREQINLFEPSPAPDAEQLGLFGGAA